MNKFLIIQTAFIGDVVLATAIAEKLHSHYPTAEIDFLLRKGNESLLENHPFINKVIVWNKNEGKYKSLLKTIKEVRKTKYDAVINPHRFASSGMITYRSKAKEKIGFTKNPLSFLFTKKVQHSISNGKHETERNQQLIADLTNEVAAKPKLYPTKADYESITEHQTQPYVCIAPASVWFTKQFPADKWVELIDKLKTSVYLLGGPADHISCEKIISLISNKNTTNLAGKLSLLQSAALMQGAEMNYVNDSAPLHFASAVNAPVTAVFCSTVPAFGFIPLSSNSKIIETKIQLDCRPCGLHGYKECPKGHFKCATTISIDQLHGN